MREPVQQHTASVIATCQVTCDYDQFSTALRVGRGYTFNQCSTCMSKSEKDWAFPRTSHNGEIALVD